MNKPQLSIESYHKLNRAKQVASYSSLIKKSGAGDELFNQLAGDLLSYINEDVAYVLNELKGLGLCDAYLPLPPHPNNDSKDGNVHHLSLNKGS